MLTDLRDRKIPALEQAGLRLARQPHILLFSRSGYTAPLEQLADDDETVTLIDVPRALSDGN